MSEVAIGLRLPNCSGILCQPEWATPATLDDLAFVARRAGLDSLWFHDHLLTPAELAHLQPANVLDSLICMARMASIAPEMAVGVAALVVPLREPVALAKQLLTLEAFFPGRVIAGLVPGRYASEFAAHGSDLFARRGEVADEFIRLVRALIEPGPTTLEGRYRSVRDAVCQPPAAVPGRPPLWIGGASRRALRRAAQLGDGWVPGGLTVDQLRAGRSSLAGLLSHQGRTLADFQIGLSLTIAPEKGRAQTPRAGGGSGLHTHTTAVRGRALDVAEQLVDYCRAGVTHFILAFQATCLEDLRDSVEWFGGEVAPLVRAVGRGANR
ncbi:MAG: LLM class flavin-dependent oxidoreductase [Chloroflexi bacterium]|nr:LLM class flavin-dependent oxidoreductase [Chloroflexota bacterium]